MPRLTNKQYLERRKLLMKNWKAGGSAFSTLSSIEQMQLHEYFAPTRKLTAAEALEHRVRASTQQPSLPQAAGKVVGQISDVFKHPTSFRRRPATVHADGRVERVVAHGIRRPPARLARVLQRLAESDMNRDKP